MMRGNAKYTAAPTTISDKDQRMKAQHAVAHRPHDAGDHDGDEREGGDVGIIADDVHQAVDLAALVPVGGGRQAPWSGWHRAAARRRETASRWRQNRRCGRGQGSRPPLPQPRYLERQHADAVNAERREMAEEQRRDASRRQREARAARRARARRPSRPAPTARCRCRKCSSSIRPGRRNCRAAEWRTAGTPTSGRSAPGSAPSVPK